MYLFWQSFDENLMDVSHLYLICNSKNSKLVHVFYLQTEVVCGEVELFASSTTTSPSEALYEVKGLARDHQPASFSIQNGGQTVYVYYKGKIVSVTEDCRNRNKTFSISFTQASGTVWLLFMSLLRIFPSSLLDTISKHNGIC